MKNLIVTHLISFILLMFIGSVNAQDKPSAELAASQDNDSKVIVRYTFEDGDKESRPHGKISDREGKYNGTLYGASYFKTNRGYVLAFNRTAYAKCMGFNFGKKDFSIEFLFKLDNAVLSGVIMGKKGRELLAPGWYISYNGKVGKLLFSFADGKKNESVEAVVNDLKWHHVVVTRQGDKVTLYIDGKGVDSRQSDLFGSNVAGKSPFFFLGKVIGNFNAFTGKIDDVIVRSRTLTGDEVKKCYDEQKDKIAALDPEQTTVSSK